MTAGFDNAAVAALEAVAYAAWPAEHVIPFHGWRLRFMAGITHRGNSVWCQETLGDLGLAERIAYVEEQYRARGLPPSVLVTPASPAGLDEVLARAGYEVDAPVFVQIAELHALAAAQSRDGVSVSSSPLPTEEWFELAGRRSRFKEVSDTYRGLLARLGAGARFALVHVGESPAATAVGVIDGAWLGVHSMLVQPEYRGRGLAAALLEELALRALDEGAKGAYLQVEQSNTSALRAYARSGFQTVYATHYRTLSAGHRDAHA